MSGEKDILAQVEPDREVWAWRVCTHHVDLRYSDVVNMDGWYVAGIGQGFDTSRQEGTAKTEEKARRAARRAVGEVAAFMATEAFDKGYRVSLGARVVVR